MPVNRTLYRSREFEREVVHMRGLYQLDGTNNPILLAGGRAMSLARVGVGLYDLQLRGVGDLTTDLLDFEATFLRATETFRVVPATITGSTRTIRLVSTSDPAFATETFQASLPPSVAGAGVAERAVYINTVGDSLVIRGFAEFSPTAPLPAALLGGESVTFTARRYNSAGVFQQDVFVHTITGPTAWPAAFSATAIAVPATNPINRNDVITLEVTTVGAIDTPGLTFSMGTSSAVEDITSTIPLAIHAVLLNR